MDALTPLFVVLAFPAGGMLGVICTAILSELIPDALIRRLNVNTLFREFLLVTCLTISALLLFSVSQGNQPVESPEQLSCLLGFILIPI